MSKPNKLFKNISIILSLVLFISLFTPYASTLQVEAAQVDYINEAQTVSQMRSALDNADLADVPVAETVIYQVTNAADVEGSISVTSGTVSSTNTLTLHLLEGTTPLDNTQKLSDISDHEQIATAIAYHISQNKVAYGIDADVTSLNDFIIFTASSADEINPADSFTLSVDDIDLDVHSPNATPAKSDAGIVGNPVTPGTTGVKEEYNLIVNDNTDKDVNGNITNSYYTSQYVAAKFTFPSLDILIDMRSVTSQEDARDSIFNAINGASSTSFGYDVTQVNIGTVAAPNYAVELLNQNTGNVTNLRYEVQDNTNVDTGIKLTIEGTIDAYSRLSENSKNKVAEAVLYYRKGELSEDGVVTYFDNLSEVAAYFNEAVRVQYTLEKVNGSALQQNAIDNVNGVNNGADMIKALEKYRDYLGLLWDAPFDYNVNIVNGYGDENQVGSIVYETKPGLGYNDIAGIQAAFNRAVSIEVINKDTSPSSLMYELEKLVNVNMLNLDLTEYNKLIRPIEVAKALIREDLNSYKKIQDFFHGAVIEQRETENQEILDDINNNIRSADELWDVLDGPDKSKRTDYARKINIDIHDPNTPASEYDQLDLFTQKEVMQGILDARDLRGGFSSLSEVKVAFETAIGDIISDYRLTPKDGETGVLSNVEGTARIEFKHPISYNGHPNLLLENNSIQIIENSTGENIITELLPITNSYELEIDYRALKANDRYTIYIQPNSLKRGSDVLNETITWTFYSEKKPEVQEFLMFQPSGNMFTYPSSIYAVGNNVLYQIPELMGVHRVGVEVNQALVVNFTESIDFAYDNPNISVVGKPTWAWGQGPSTHIPETTLEINGKELIVKFINNNDVNRFLEHGMTYSVTIPPGILKSAEGGTLTNDRIKVDFATVDGFKSTLMEGDSQDIDELFQSYAPRNIAVKVPKVYIQNVETIHRYQGLAPSEQIGANLTNLDIYTDESVASMRVVTDQGTRSNLRKIDGRFTTGFVGLAEQTSNLSLYAYDKYGKLLEKRSFKLGATSGEEAGNNNDGAVSYVKDDYIAEFTDIMGKTHSLYELMRDPAILEEVLQHIPVSELDRLGMFYPAFSPYSEVPVQ